MEASRRFSTTPTYRHDSKRLLAPKQHAELPNNVTLTSMFTTQGLLKNQEKRNLPNSRRKHLIGRNTHSVAVTPRLAPIISRHLSPTTNEIPQTSKSKHHQHKNSKISPNVFGSRFLDKQDKKFNNPEVHVKKGLARSGRTNKMANSSTGFRRKKCRVVPLGARKNVTANTIVSATVLSFRIR